MAIFLAPKYLDSAGFPGCASQNLLDLGHAPIRELQTQREDDRLVELLHDAEEARLPGLLLIGNVDLEGRRSLGGADPQTIADGDFGGVLGEADVGGQRQTGGVVSHHRFKILIDQCVEAGAVAGIGGRLSQQRRGSYRRTQYGNCCDLIEHALSPG
jgi:hypothetical protein